MVEYTSDACELQTLFFDGLGMTPPGAKFPQRILAVEARYEVNGIYVVYK